MFQFQREWSQAEYAHFSGKNASYTVDFGININLKICFTSNAICVNGGILFAVK